MESRMEAYLNAAISGDTENLPKPISRIDFLLCELIKTLGESGASIEEVEKIVTDKVAEIVADAPKDFDTLKELSDWIYTHEESAAAMNTAIQSKVDKEEGKSLISDTEIARLANVENYDDSQMKEYVDSKIAFYDGIVSRSTNTDTTNCWVKIAECEAPNSTAQIMDEITLYPKTTDSAVKTTCKVRVEGKGAYANTWKLHIIDSTKDFNSDKVKLIYDKNIVDDKRKIELWGYNINGWDGFYSQKTFGNNYTLTYGLKCLTSQNKFATTYLHDDFAEAPTIDISIKSLVNEGLTSLENDIALNRTTLGTQCKNLLNWKNANTDESNNVTYTKTDNDITTTSNGSWGHVTYKLPALEIGTKYTFSAAVSNLLQASATARIRIAYDLGGTNKITDINLTENGEYKADFTPTESAVYVLFYPNFSANTYTNSFTASDIMLRYADIIDDTYEPYSDSIDERLIKDKSNIAINKTTLGYRCKNLLKNTSVTTTKSGITFTVNSDGSVTVNGTNTSSGTAYIQLCGFVDYGDGKLIASIGQNITDVYMAMYDSDWNWIGTGSAGTISWENSSKKRLVRLAVKSGATINNVTVYPMIRYADITDSTYEPYKESVDERLIQNKSDIVLNRATLGTQCKNLLKPTSSITRAGITYTVNEDGSVTLTGRSTTGSTYNYFSIPITLKPGKYKVNGMPETSKTTTYRTDLRATESGGTTYGYGVKEFEVEFTETTTAYYMIRIDGSYKESLNGITFYPMIRYADIADSTYEPYQPSLQEQIIGTYFPTTQEKGLANNTDLNTITEIGNYICYTGSSAATMINCPTKTGGFRLIVTNLIVSSNDNSTIRYQWIIPNNLNDVLCFRRRIDLSLNTFSSWYSFGGTIVS